MEALNKRAAELPPVEEEVRASDMGFPGRSEVQIYISDPHTFRYIWLFPNVIKMARREFMKGCTFDPSDTYLDTHLDIYPDTYPHNVLYTYVHVGCVFVPDCQVIGV